MNKTIPDFQETKHLITVMMIVYIKCDIALLQDRSTSNEGVNVYTHNEVSSASKPTASPASKIDNNFSASKHLFPPQLPPKLTIKSPTSPAGKPSVTPSSCINLLVKI